MYDYYVELRDKKGMKDSDVALSAGIRQGILSDWKSGKSTPSARNLQKIARVLGTTTDYLIDGTIIDGFINDEEGRLLDGFRSLNLDGQESALKYVGMMIRLSEYQKRMEKPSDSETV